jgi:hypothetical protein
MEFPRGARFTPQSVQSLFFNSRRPPIEPSSPIDDGFLMMAAIRRRGFQPSGFDQPIISGNMARRHPAARTEPHRARRADRRGNDDRGSVARPRSPRLLWPLYVPGRRLRQVLRGWMAYYAVPMSGGLSRKLSTGILPGRGPPAFFS